MQSNAMRDKVKKEISENDMFKEIKEQFAIEKRLEEELRGLRNSEEPEFL